MQTTSALQSYDRSIVVPHLPVTTMQYRVSYGMQIPCNEALKIVSKALKIRNEKDLIKATSTKLTNYVHGEYTHQVLLVENHKKKPDVIVLSAVPFDRPIELFYELIIHLATIDPYLGLYCGYVFGWIIRRYKLQPYIDQGYSSPESVLEMIASNDDLSDNDRKHYADAVKREEQLFKNMDLLSDRCYQHFYKDPLFSNHKFVQECNQLMNSVKNLNFKWYENTMDAVSPKANKVIFSFTDHDRIDNCNLEIGLAYRLSPDDGFPCENEFTAYGTATVLETGEFCGYLVDYADHQNAYNAYMIMCDGLAYMHNNYFIKNLKIPWENLSDLTSILSYTKMDTLKEGILSTKKPKARSVQRTLLEVLS